VGERWGGHTSPGAHRSPPQSPWAVAGAMKNGHVRHGGGGRGRWEGNWEERALRAEERAAKAEREVASLREELQVLQEHALSRVEGMYESMARLKEENRLLREKLRPLPDLSPRSRGGGAAIGGGRVLSPRSIGGAHGMPQPSRRGGEATAGGSVGGGGQQPYMIGGPRGRRGEGGGVSVVEMEDGTQMRVDVRTGKVLDDEGHEGTELL
jgi:hypothetical protein